jgi:hypothetical protein
LLFTPFVARAADHGDAPGVGPNQGADIADVYFFLDPNDNDQVVLIATLRGLYRSRREQQLRHFDPNVRCHFELETTGDTKSDKFIDVTFTPRTAVDGPAGKEILQVPQPQKANISFTGFKDADGKKIKGFSDVATTGSATTQVPPGAAPAQVLSDLGSTGIKFFAGMVDDPFFFDIPAFGAFIASVRNGSPNPAGL